MEVGFCGGFAVDKDVGRGDGEVDMPVYEVEGSQVGRGGRGEADIGGLRTADRVVAGLQPVEAGEFEPTLGGEEGVGVSLAPGLGAGGTLRVGGREGEG